MEGGVFEDIMLTMMKITLLRTLLMLVLNDFELVIDIMCKEEFLLKILKYHQLLCHHQKGGE